MRTVPFKTLYQHLIGRMGFDPLTDVGQAIARNVVRILNEVIADTWTNTPFPELTLTEERGFRQVWSPFKQYQLGDEIIFHVDRLYYVASGQPPLGQSPATSPIWHPMDTVEHYVDFDQPRQKPIGAVYGIYNSDPSIGPGANPDGSVTGCDCCPQGLDYQPSQNGVRVLSPCGNTVWVWYYIVCPQYTVVPYIAEHGNYQAGDRAYIPEVGRVYKTIAAQSTGQPNPALWFEEIVPEFMLGYLVSATCAAYLRTGQADQAAQTRIGMAALAEAEATSRYQGLVDSLGQQGYKPRMKWPARPGCNNNSQPWLGDVAIPITVDLLGTMPETPVIPIATGVTWEYQPEINFLRASEGLPSLDGLSTSRKDAKSFVELVIGGQRMTFQLAGGEADPDDPGQVAPLDYAAVTNNKHWERVT
jgi:hypothetical protein